MESLPDDAPLLYRAKYLSGLIEEDRRDSSRRWDDAVEALDAELARASRHALQRHLAFVLGLVLLITTTVAVWRLAEGRAGLAGSGLAIAVLFFWLVPLFSLLPLLLWDLGKRRSSGADERKQLGHD